MKEKWDMRIWGTRGSLPMAAEAYMEYGGNTSCVSVECSDRLVIFDAGSGLARLGVELACRETFKPVHLFISHPHIDHLIGLFGFSPLYDKRWEIHMYGEARNGSSFKGQLENLIGPPYWPVGLEDFQARVHIHEIQPGEKIMLEPDTAIKTMRGKHPGNVLLFSMEAPGKKVGYSLDCEPDEDIMKKAAAFFQGADIILWDAQYTPEDLEQKKGWGHSSWKQGICLKQTAGIKRIVMAHYSWEYTDDILRKQEQEALREDPGCCFGREGMEFQI